MYYPINWPKIVRLPELVGSELVYVGCNRDKVLLAILSPDTLVIVHSKPCVPVACWKRDLKSVDQYGVNQQLEWKPDSSLIGVMTSKGYLAFYELNFSSDHQCLYDQRDSLTPGLQRESAELYVKDTVPFSSLKLSQIIPIESGATGLVCIRDELMVATKYGHVLRYSWNGTLNRDYCLDLRRIPFCVDQLAARAVPITEPNTYIIQIDYSPLLGGFAIVLNDGRGAFLTSTTLKFDPNQVQGIWAPLEDVTCTAINHRYRLMAFGRRNSHAEVYSIDETTGGLQLSHTLQLSSRDFPGYPGPVKLLKWSPDGCCLALCWSQGAISLWSTFGALLLCTLNWDYGPSQDVAGFEPLAIRTLDWGIEGYQMWMVSNDNGQAGKTCLLQMEMVKSPLTANPCMSSKERLYLQGQDRVYINISDAPSQRMNQNECAGEPGALLSSKQWLMIQVPSTYLSGNWPLRFASLDARCENLAVAGRTGFALYSMITRRWKLFGNESQEKDFVVAGGLLWWNQQLVIGCYSITADMDEVRIYPRDVPRLDNSFCTVTNVTGQMLLLNIMRDVLLVYTSDCHISLFKLEQRDLLNGSASASLEKTQEIDVSTLGLHPACLVAATLTSLSTEPHRVQVQQSMEQNQPENILLNVCGRVLLIQSEILPSSDEMTEARSFYAAPTVLASSVEILWVPNPGSVCPRKPHLTQALWLCCGAHGMRVWLPLYPREGDKSHTFMSKRIMLPFKLYIYPLSVLFEEAILLGVETETVHYPSSASSDWLRKMPFCVLERNSQVYLHHIFRQLIRRNLGFHAWEIARGCTSLPYFSHSLELLLHEVLEEEATSKEPIPDALLPSVLEFIQEFPVYLTTIVQCARKTEVALWPYLFGTAANPRQLFQRCLELKQLDIAASYLIILQNMEPVSISRQYATILLDAALENGCWDLAKDLVRFLRAIDPSDGESCGWKPGSAPSTGSLLASKISIGSQTPPVSPNPEDLNFLLGSTVHRGRNPGTTSAIKPAANETQHREVTRSSSEGKITPIPVQSASRNEASTSAGGSSSAKTVVRKKSVPIHSSHPITIPNDDNAMDEELFMDVILQRHVRKMLSSGRLRDLGYLAAHFDAPLVSWLSRERTRAARVEDFVSAIRRLHMDFSWPYPSLPNGYPLPRLSSQNRSSSNGLEEKLQALEVDVTQGAPFLPTKSHLQPEIGDSGYLSTVGSGDNGQSERSTVINHQVNGAKSHASGGLLLQTVEAQLQPHLSPNEDGSVNSDADLMSSIGEDRVNDCDNFYGSMWSLNSASVSFESAFSNSQESSKYNVQSEMQMRYLLQLFIEADCLDWALILALMLRDAMAILRLVNVARSALTNPPSSSTNVDIETVTRLRDGLIALSHWIEIDCQGYRPFMGAIYGQIGSLTKLIIPSKIPSVLNPCTQRSTDPCDSPVKSNGSSVPAPAPLSVVCETEEVEVVANGKVEAVDSKQPETPSGHPSIVREETLREGSGCVIS